jgi:zinc transporter 1/2/3
MDLQVVKLLILTGLFIVSFILGILPVQLTWYYRGRSTTTSKIYDRTRSILSCFAGGVFLATSTLDLLPDTREILKENMKNSGVLSDYPLGEFIMVLGLILMLTTEQIALIYNGKQESHHTVSRSTLNSIVSDKIVKNEESETLLSAKENVQISYHSPEPLFHSDYDIDKGKTRNIQNNRNNMSNVPNSVSSTFRSILLLIALSLHSVFEGLAVGLQKNLSDVFEITIGILIHKAIIAFSLGMTLAQSTLSYFHSFLSVLTFSLASPIGIGFGLMIVKFRNGSSSSLTEGIFQGLACGTFLYITLFEIVQHELRNSDLRLVKILFLFFGFICMSLLFLIDGH